MTEDGAVGGINIRTQYSALQYNDENSLSCVIGLAFYSARDYYTIVREMPSGKGFADIFLIPRPKHMDKPVIVIELKKAKDAHGAIDQIKQKNYVKTLEDYKGNLLLAGINYDNMAENRQAEQSVTRVMEQLRSGEMAPQTESLAEFRQETPYTPGVSVVTDIIEQEIPDYLLNPGMDMPETVIDNYAYIGVLEIPTCSLELPVISEWSYPALKIAPCRYEGSVYTDDIIIAAHDYKAHFKAVRDLKGGEKVLFTDTDGNTFIYEVTGKETIAGSDLASLTDGEWDLILFTCTFDGRSRVVIECSRVE